MPQVNRLDTSVPWKEQDYGGKRPGKSACVQRYGGFGDMMQISSLFPGLKEQGYRITVNTTPESMRIIKNDPHIDEFFLQENDVVPNQELGYYWSALSECFDKFIMLSESIEGALLALPERRQSAWHPEYRRMIVGNVDYMEATHAIAEVPMPPRIRFYPTKKEKAWAKKYRAKLGKDNFIILYALSGSAVHKVWPWGDQLIARLLLKYKNVKFVTCGDTLCQALELGWEKETRAVRKSGKWTIRQTLAFAEECNLIFGPETGVLNAMAMRPMKKIMMLSHSGPGNIGGNWINTSLALPLHTPCYPCHILHRGFDICNRDELSGGAMCAANTPVEGIFETMVEEIEDWVALRSLLKRPINSGGIKNEQHVLKPMPEIPQACGDIR